MAERFDREKAVGLARIEVLAELNEEESAIKLGFYITKRDGAFEMLPGLEQAVVAAASELAKQLDAASADLGMRDAGKWAYGPGAEKFAGLSNDVQVVDADDLQNIS